MTSPADAAVRSAAPTRTARVLCVAALLGAFFVQRDRLGDTWLPWVPMLWGSAALLGLVAWWWSTPVPVDSSLATPGPPTGPAAGRRRAFSIVLPVALLALALGLAILHNDLLSPRGAWLWLAGLGGYALAWTLRDGPSTTPTARDATWRLRAATVLALGLIAFGLRLYQLDALPPTFLQDEAAVAEWGLNWLHGSALRGQGTAEAVTIFRNGTTAYPLPGSVLQALVMQVAGETVFGARLTAAVAGGLTVWVLWRLLADFASPTAALVGALLLSVNHVDLYWTRSGMLQSLTTLVATVVVWQTLRGIRSGRHLPFVLAGLALGAAQYLYEGARFLVPILVLFFAHQAVTVRGFLRRRWAHIAHMALVSAVVFAPIGFWYWQHPEEVLQRSRAVAVFLNPAYLASRYPGLSTMQVVLAQWRKSLLGFAWYGDGSAAFYDLRAPMVDPVTGALVVFGILGLTLRPRPRHVSLVALWFWVPVAIACTITIDPPPMTRLCLTIPAWCAIAALAFDRLAATFRPTRRVTRIGFAAIVVVALGYAGLWNLRLFFERYPQTLPANGWTVIGRLVRAKGPDFKSYMVSPMYLYAGSPEMRFWARGLAMDDLAVDAIPVRERGYRNGLFVVAPQLAPALATLRTAYPGGRVQEHRDALGRLLFTSYEVDAAALNATAGPDAPWRQPDARFGLRGTRRGQFRDGSGLAVSTAGRVYVADAGNGRIVTFDRDGTPLGRLRPPRTGDDAFRALAGVAVTPDGRVFALDRAARTITRFSPEGAVELRIVLADLPEPSALAAAPDGTLLVTDTGQRTLVRLTADGRVAGRATAANHFESPTAVAAASDGSVYVVDAAQGRVHRLSAELAPQSDWPLRRAAPPSASSIAVSPIDGAVYVIHAGTGSIGRYTPDGRFTWTVGDGGGTAPLLGPTAVATDAEGSLYVLDGTRNQVCTLRRRAPGRGALSGVRCGIRSS